MTSSIHSVPLVPGLSYSKPGLSPPDPQTSTVSCLQNEPARIKPESAVLRYYFGKDQAFLCTFTRHLTPRMMSSDINGMATSKATQMHEHFSPTGEYAVPGIGSGSVRSVMSQVGLGLPSASVSST